MKLKSILWYGAIHAVLLSAGSFGLAGVASASASIAYTGPYSYNYVTQSDWNSFRRANWNSVGITNNTNQHATTGNAVVYGNTIGGSATSGPAYNTANTWTNAQVNNGGSGLGAWNGGGGQGQATIMLTGPHSANVIEDTSRNTYESTNSNNVYADNQTDQYASSGDAVVAGNTIGGSASSGPATNTAATTTSVDVENHDNGSSGSSGGNGGGNYSINTTGPGSYNAIRSDSSNSYTSTNTNNVGVGNTTSQSAQSGNAIVSGNTIGGNATSGAAVNNASTATDVTIHNM